MGGFQMKDGAGLAIHLETDSRVTCSKPQQGKGRADRGRRGLGPEVGGEGSKFPSPVSRVLGESSGTGSLRKGKCFCAFLGSHQ